MPARAHSVCPERPELRTRSGLYPIAVSRCATLGALRFLNGSSALVETTPVGRACCEAGLNEHGWQGIVAERCRLLCIRLERPSLGLDDRSARWCRLVDPLQDPIPLDR